MTKAKGKKAQTAKTDNERIAALAACLNVSPDEIREERGNTFAVRPHTVKDGTSPEHAQELVALLRKGLEMIPVIFNATKEELAEPGNGACLHDPCTDQWTLEHVRTLGYQCIQSQLHAHCPPEMFKVGPHDLVNTLYFLCPDTDGNDHAKDHRDTVREAFAGLPIQDRRKPRQTDDGEYLVVTDEEADELWNESLESYLDDCVLPELPEHARTYFDRERWKEDAKTDGRAHSLGRYDGNEECVTFDDYADLLEDPEAGLDEAYYIYRQN